jgi:Zn-finger nucleic acid-binding protein
MNCPLCLDTVLDVTYHAGIELDICPKCRGVWLDRGELNKIVDELESRSSGAPAARRDDRAGAWNDDDRQPDHRFDQRPRPGRDDDRYADRPVDRYTDRHPDRGRKKKKQSFASRLGDVFEEIVDF